MRIFSDLLFHHGHIANADLARQLAPPAPQVQTPSAGATHPHLHLRAKVRERQARRIRLLTALSPFR